MDVRESGKNGWWSLKRFLSKQKTVEEDEEDDFDESTEMNQDVRTKPRKFTKVRAEFSCGELKQWIKGKFYVISSVFEYQFCGLNRSTKSYMTFKPEKLNYRKKAWSKKLLLQMVDGEENKTAVMSWIDSLGREVTEFDVLLAWPHIKELEDVVHSEVGVRYFYYSQLADIERYYNKKSREFVINNLSLREIMKLHERFETGEGLDLLCFNHTKNMIPNLHGLPELNYEGFQAATGGDYDPIIDNAVSIYHEILKKDIYGHSMSDICNPVKRRQLLYMPETTGHMYTQYGIIEMHCRKRALCRQSLRWLAQNGIVHQPPIDLENLQNMSTARHIYIIDMWQAQERLINHFVSIAQRWRDQGYEQGMTHREGSFAKKSKRKLNSYQKKAVQAAIDHPISVITGMGGTGKTEAVKDVVELYGEDDLESSRVLFVGPTGMSAVNVSDRVHPAYTIDKVIHTLRKAFMREKLDMLDLSTDGFALDDDELQDDPQWYLAPSLGQRRENEKKKNELLFRLLVRSWKNVEVLIMDETSMVDLKKVEFLLRLLLHFSKNLKKLVFVGDCRQLQSIRPGCFMLDVMKAVPEAVTELKKNMRNPSATIFYNALACIRRDSNLKYDDSFRLVHCVKDGVDIGTTVASTLKKLISQEGVNKYNIHFITFKRRDAIAINKACRPFYTDQYDSRSNRANLPEYFVGEKIYFKKNNYSYGVMNGQIWIVMRYVDVTRYGTPDYTIQSNLETPKAAIRRRIAELQSEDGSKTVYINLSELPFDFDTVSLGYATTIHKYEGKENQIICYHHPDSSRFENVSHFYTAITRSTRSVILLSNTPTIRKTISKCAPLRRSSMSDYLRAALQREQEEEEEEQLQPTKKQKIA